MNLFILCFFLIVIGYYLNDINSILIEQNITGQSFKVQDLETDVANILDYVNDQKGIITRFILACGSECMKEVLLQVFNYTIHQEQSLKLFVINILIMLYLSYVLSWVQ